MEKGFNNKLEAITTSQDKISHSSVNWQVTSRDKK